MKILEKLMLIKTECNMIKIVVVLSWTVLLFTNVYLIVGKSGIRLAPGWYDWLIAFQ